MKGARSDGLLADRYTVDGPIGRGRSTVYRGTDTRLHRAVALKEVKLTSGHESLDRVRRRALREGRAAARLHHPSVVAVFDVIEEDDSIWLVMELVDAPSLAQLVDGTPLDHARAARVGVAVLDALDAAHDVGVVHRDVKPANVLVPAGDEPAKLADFGVATVGDDTRVTATGMMVGSPAFMAPEQARGEEAGPPADLWALGATLYYAYEGVPPFNGGSAVATATAVVHFDPRPELHPGPLSAIVRRLLAKDPARRPATAEVRQALVDAAGAASTAVAAPAVAPPVAPVTPRRDQQTDVTRIVPGRPRGRERAIGIAVLLLAALGAVWALRSDPDDNTDPPQEDAASSTSAPSTAAPTTTTAPDEDEDEDDGEDAAGVPDGWQTYSDPQAGYTIAYPAGWEVVPGNPRTDFRDPETGSYLRVDWTATPRPDPVADWRAQSARFAGSHEAYEEIGIAAADYRDYNAALWEFRYTADGTRYHAADLGFVAGDRGYALYFHTSDTHWPNAEPLLDQFKESFQPTG